MQLAVAVAGSPSRKKSQKLGRATGMLFEVSQRILQDLFHSERERTRRPVGQAR